MKAQNRPKTLQQSHWDMYVRLTKMSIAAAKADDQEAAAQLSEQAFEHKRKYDLFGDKFTLYVR